MIKHRLWCAAALAATFILAGCSHSSSPGQGRPQAWLEPGTRVTLPAPGITPPLNAQQLLTGRFHGQTQSLLVMLNADEQKVTLAGLSSMGIRLFLVTYDEKGLHTEQSIAAPQLPPASQVLADVMLSHWPISAWQPQLPKGWTLTDIGNKRELRNAHGKLVTESLRDFTRINLAKQYESLDTFLQAWSSADRKQALIDELQHHGVLLDVLAEELAQEKGDGSSLQGADPFDVLLHVAYDQPILTRSERAQRAKKKLADDGIYAKYGETARKVLDVLIDKYADEGISAIENTDVLKVQPLTQMGSPVELMQSFGGSKLQYQDAMAQLGRAIYQPARD